MKRLSIIITLLLSLFPSLAEAKDNIDITYHCSYVEKPANTLVSFTINIDAEQTYMIDESTGERFDILQSNKNLIVGVSITGPKTDMIIESITIDKSHNNKLHFQATDIKVDSLQIIQYDQIGKCIKDIK